MDCLSFDYNPFMPSPTADCKRKPRFPPVKFSSPRRLRWSDGRFFHRRFCFFIQLKLLRRHGARPASAVTGAGVAPPECAAVHPRRQSSRPRRPKYSRTTAWCCKARDDRPLPRDRFARRGRVPRSSVLCRQCSRRAPARLPPRDRLAIRDNGQRLQRRLRQPRGTVFDADQRLKPRRKFRLRDELHAPATHASGSCARRRRVRARALRARRSHRRPWFS